MLTKQTENSRTLKTVSHITLSALSVLGLLSATLPTVAHAEPDAPQAPITVSAEIRAKILTQAVPADALDRMLEYRTKNIGDQVLVDVYTCPNAQNPIGVCSEDKRVKSSRKITVVDNRYMVIVDFGKPSTQKRMHLIDITTGDVKSFFAAHGKGSGKDSKWAYKFSNTKDSLQTSLGIYQTGGVYNGSHGETIRLYGLQRSNDQSYIRDIVMHGAPYAREAFITSINPSTKKPFGRLGLSWGCPAVAPEVHAKLTQLIKEGVLFMNYHPELIDAAQSGQPVETTLPEN